MKPTEFVTLLSKLDPDMVREGECAMTAPGLVCKLLAQEKGRMREIVAGRAGATVTNCLEDIAKAAAEGRLSELYDRSQMRFMAACGLGGNWARLADAPTLFVIEDDGNYVWPPKEEEEQRWQRM